MSNYKPCGHRVVLKMDKIDEVSKGGIILVHENGKQGAAVTGTVMEVGEDCWYDKPSKWASVGDKVLIAKYAGAAIDEFTRIVNDEDILSIVEKST